MNKIPNKSRIKTRLKTAKGRPVSSQHWLSRHLNDPYVAEARKLDYRSRACFKLLDIDKKYHLLSQIRHGCAIDLGCAPGSWLQVLERHCSPQTPIIGVDIQSIAPLDRHHTHFIHGDFTTTQTQSSILTAAANTPIRLLLSDMAPATSGDRCSDQIILSDMVQEVLTFCQDHLERGGNLACKLIEGSGSAEIITRARQLFSQIRIFKPPASYKDSSETFLIGLGRK